MEFKATPAMPLPPGSVSEWDGPARVAFLREFAPDLPADVVLGADPIWMRDQVQTRAAQMGWTPAALADWYAATFLPNRAHWDEETMRFAAQQEAQAQREQEEEDAFADYVQVPLAEEVGQRVPRIHSRDDLEREEQDLFENVLGPLQQNFGDDFDYDYELDTEQGFRLIRRLFQNALPQVVQDAIQQEYVQLFAPAPAPAPAPEAPPAPWPPRARQHEAQPSRSPSPDTTAPGEEDVPPNKRHRLAAGSGATATMPNRGTKRRRSASPTGDQEDADSMPPGKRARPDGTHTSSSGYSRPWTPKFARVGDVPFWW